MQSKIYNTRYDDCGALKRHDHRSDLERWFDNYKLDHLAHFYARSEWLVIEELEELRRGRKRYRGEIGSDFTQVGRTVLFEPGAPPPPTFFHHVERRCEAPLPTSRLVDFHLGPRPMMMRYGLTDHTLYSDIGAPMRYFNGPPAPVLIDILGAIPPSYLAPIPAPAASPSPPPRPRLRRNQ